MNIVNVTVTGAAGQIAYALLPRLGELLTHPDMLISLRLLDIEPCMQTLQGVVMELEDCALPFIHNIIYTADPKVAFDNTHYAVLIGARPRSKGMQRADLLQVNAAIFKEQGKVINDVASRDCMTLVVGNPCNTNAYIAMISAPDMPNGQFFAMSMLDQHRATFQMAHALSVPLSSVENMCVWGNHSNTMFADFYHASIAGQSFLPQYADRESWFQNTFIPSVATRGSEVINMRGSSSAASAANATLDTLIALIDKDSTQGPFSLAVCSQGEYGATPGTIVSYPCHFDASGSIQVVADIQHNDFAQARMAASFAEIAQEAESITC